MQVEYKHYLLLALLRRRRRRHQEAASPWLHHQFITAAKKKVRAGITISKKLKQQRLEGHLSLWWGRPGGGHASESWNACSHLSIDHQSQTAAAGGGAAKWLVHAGHYNYSRLAFAAVNANGGRPCRLPPVAREIRSRRRR